MNSNVNEEIQIAPTRPLPCLLRLLLAAVILLPFAGLRAQTITVVNQLANGYSYDPFTEACPNGQPISNIPSGYHVERPHAIYNSSTKQWVLWAHYDDSNYTTAEALVATSSTECGPYTIYQTFQPFGDQIRDDFLYEDTDGSAYFIAASNKDGGANDTMAIFKLTSDYLTVDTSAGMDWVFEGLYREAPIVVKNGSTYFLLTSQAAGWFPSQGGYGTSSAMLSGWSALSDLGNPSTYGGQESGIKVISGSAGTAYILVMDHLGGNGPHDDGDLWLPLSLSGTTASLSFYSSFKVNQTTGALTLPSSTDYAHGATATASSVASGSSASYAADANYTTRWIASSATYPAWWMADLGSTKNIGEIDLSWYMIKGSEAYFTYTLQYSTDGTNFTTIDRTGNQLYGFTSDVVNIAARYVKVNIVGGAVQNNPNMYYTPTLWEGVMLPQVKTQINVANYNFASPVTSSYVYNPSGAGWTFTGSSGNGSGVTTNGSSFTSSNPLSTLGTQVAFLQGNASMTQTLTGLVVGTTYSVTFQAAQRANKTGGQAGQTLEVLANGKSIGTYAPSATSTNYISYLATFTATATSEALEFLGTDTNGGDNTLLLNNVRVFTTNY